MSKLILANAAEVKNKKANVDAGPKPKAETKPKAKAKESAKAKEKTKAKEKAVKPSVCPIRCQHDGGDKKFECWWNKLRCQTFKYVSAKDKPRAKALADDWLAMMGAKHGLAAPAITF